MTSWASPSRTTSSRPQAAAFARISATDTGRASTRFNALRQLGGAAGVAVLTSVLTAVGMTHHPVSPSTPDLHAYHVAFLVAAGLALAAIALTIHDPDADSTRPRLSPEPATPDPGLASQEPGYGRRHGSCRRWVRCPSWSKMPRISAGLSRAPKACEIMVENSAA